MIDDIRPGGSKPTSAPPLPGKSIAVSTDEKPKSPPPKAEKPETKEAENEIAPDEEIDLSQPDGEPADEKPDDDAKGDDSKQEDQKDKDVKKKNKKQRRSPWAWFKGLKQWQKFAIIVALIVLLVAAAFSAYYWHYKHQLPFSNSITNKPAPSNTVASRLTGVQVSKTVYNMPVTGVMIENSDDARPQSGLDQAGVVFEAVAEGGITRFLALYEDTQPSSIGPVRSARPYYIRWLLPFDAAYAHVGGSPQALSDITSLGVKDLNQFYNGASYIRVSSRAAPHNVYTSIAALQSLEQQKGYSSSNFTGWPRKKAAPAATPTVTSIDMSVSGPDFNPHYDYDQAKNAYKRSEGGAPHTELPGNNQIEPNVVIAMVIPSNIDPDGDHTDYNTTAGGQVLVFQDGGVTKGTWSKAGDKSQIVFTNADGSVLRLNPGQTWVTMVQSTSDVTYH